MIADTSPMPTGAAVETRGHITGFREEIARAASASPDAFFTWFDAATDADAAFVRGQWDFNLHIASPMAPFVREPESKTVLEIGSGAGRLLAGAARSFGHAIGVDVHDQQSAVRAELARRGVTNATLLSTDGRTLPVPDASVDAAYSFIVFQHLERIDTLRAYLAETARVLKPGGIAVLYAGRPTRFSMNSPSPLMLALDLVRERWTLRAGYEEIAAPVNCTNLRVTRPFLVRETRRAGLTVRRTLVSRKKVPDGVLRFGGQHGVVAMKPLA